MTDYLASFSLQNISLISTVKMEKISQKVTHILTFQKRLHKKNEDEQETEIQTLTGLNGEEKK